MDDGTLINKANPTSFLICTHGFEFEEVTYLSTLLNKKWNLLTKVRFNKKQPVIAISAKCYPLFKSLIYPYIKEIPSMESKFPIVSQKKARIKLKNLEDIV